MTCTLHFWNTAFRPNVYSTLSLTLDSSSLILVVEFSHDGGKSEMSLSCKLKSWNISVKCGLNSRAEPGFIEWSVMFIFCMFLDGSNHPPLQDSRDFGLACVNQQLSWRPTFGTFWLTYYCSTSLKTLTIWEKHWLKRWRQSGVKCWWRKTGICHWKGPFQMPGEGWSWPKLGFGSIKFFLQAAPVPVKANDCFDPSILVVCLCCFSQSIVDWKKGPKLKHHFHMLARIKNTCPN